MILNERRRLIVRTIDFERKGGGATSIYRSRLRSGSGKNTMKFMLILSVFSGVTKSYMS